MNEAQAALSYEVEVTVKPLLKRMKEISSDPEQSACLVDILESNLSHLVNTYGNPNGLTTVYRRLTRAECLVASMIRQGQSTKVIAQSLDIAVGTVNIHRKHIRKKLGISNQITTLQGYLKSMED